MDWKTLQFDWNRARAFLVTAEEGSLSAAARALNTTQPTLGRQVTALEQELGVTLFERVNNQLVLTETGLDLLHQVKKMGDAANLFSITASGKSQDVSGTVCISVGELDGFYRVPHLISYLQQTAPGIQLEVVVSNSVSDLKRREADIAIRSFRPEQTDLIARKLANERIYLLGSHSYLKQLNESKSYLEPKLIGFDRSTLVTEQLTALGINVLDKNYKAYTTFQMLHVQLAKQHLGLGLFPEYILTEEPELGVAYPEKGELFELPLWLVCHKELHTSLKVRKVFDAIVHLMAESRA